MNDTKYSKRYYSKEKYEPSIETFGTGLVFLFVGLISIFKSFKCRFHRPALLGFLDVNTCLFHNIRWISPNLYKSKFQKSCKSCYNGSGIQGHA